MTLTVHVTDFPSAVIVTVVVPALRAVMRPSDVTEAVAGDRDENRRFWFVASAGSIVGSN